MGIFITLLRIIDYKRLKFKRNDIYIFEIFKLEILPRNKTEISNFNLAVGFLSELKKSCSLFIFLF